MADKLPSKYLNRFQETQKYHEDSDFYQHNGDDDYGNNSSYVNYNQIIEGTIDLYIADKNARNMTTLADIEQSVAKEKVNPKYIGNCNIDLGMSFDVGSYVPQEDHSNFLIANVGADKPLLNNYDDLNCALKSNNGDNKPNENSYNIIIVSPIFKIDSISQGGYPSQHYVWLNDQPQGLWDGITIANFCKDNQWLIPPQFQEYLDWGV